MADRPTEYTQRVTAPLNPTAQRAHNGQRCNSPEGVPRHRLSCTAARGRNSDPYQTNLLVVITFHAVTSQRAAAAYELLLMRIQPQYAPLQGKAAAAAHESLLMRIQPQYTPL